MFLVPDHTLLAVRQPVRQRKIHRLVEVDLFASTSAPTLGSHGSAPSDAATHPVVEAAVIRFREGDHKLVRALIARHDAHTLLLEPTGVHHRHELEEESRLLLEQLGRFRFHGGLELVRVLARDAIPCFGLSPEHCAQVSTGPKALIEENRRCLGRM
jgi:hypothetical protein